MYPTANALFSLFLVALVPITQTACSDYSSVSRLLRCFFHLPFRADTRFGFSFWCCLRQVDKLVQLLESPIFLRLRLQLLDVDSPSYPALLKSLYGILMLLPQVKRAA